MELDLDKVSLFSLMYVLSLFPGTSETVESIELKFSGKLSLVVQMVFG